MSAIKRRMRCAVYTRKSTEEGLDQEYNSIDAQRDAGHAYIASQRAEGWIPVADDYDDPAFSGGNMERPSLRRMMADIEAGKIDVVVIYKIDRLTRRPIDKGHIYKLLNNRTYLGELRHKDQWYQAEHPAIIDQELWNSVHAILATNGNSRANTTRGKVPFLLKGIAFGNDGRALSPWHTTKKNGRRYRYYIPQRDAKEHAGASGLPRLPAAELESAVLDQLRAILRAPNLLGDKLPQVIKLDPTLDEAKISVAMTRLDAIWDQLFPAEQTRIVKLLVEKVIVSPNDLEVRLHANGIERLVLEMNPKQVEQPAEALA